MEHQLKEAAEKNDTLLSPNTYLFMPIFINYHFHFFIKKI